MAGTSTVSAIASARRAAVADRYAANSLAVEWRYLSELETIAAVRVSAILFDVFEPPAATLPEAPPAAASALIVASNVALTAVAPETFSA